VLDVVEVWDVIVVETLPHRHSTQGARFAHGTLALHSSPPAVSSTASVQLERVAMNERDPTFAARTVPCMVEQSRSICARSLSLRSAPHVGQCARTFVRLRVVLIRARIGSQPLSTERRRSPVVSSITTASIATLSPPPTSGAPSVTRNRPGGQGAGFVGLERAVPSTTARSAAAMQASRVRRCTRYRRHRCTPVRHEGSIGCGLRVPIPTSGGVQGMLRGRHKEDYNEG